MDEREIRRGMRVSFIKPGWDSSETEFLTGKVKGTPNPELPYMFLIKADDGRTYEVNAHAILMQLP